jgi:hypothetical protein
MQASSQVESRSTHLATSCRLRSTSRLNFRTVGMYRKVICLMSNLGSECIWDWPEDVGSDRLHEHRNWDHNVVFIFPVYLVIECNEMWTRTVRFHSKS